MDYGMGLILFCLCVAAMWLMHRALRQFKSITWVRADAEVISATSRRGSSSDTLYITVAYGSRPATRIDSEASPRYQQELLFPESGWDKMSNHQNRIDNAMARAIIDVYYAEDDPYEAYLQLPGDGMRRVRGAACFLAGGAIMGLTLVYAKWGPDGLDASSDWALGLVFRALS